MKVMKTQTMKVRHEDPDDESRHEDPDDESHEDPDDESQA